MTVSSTLNKIVYAGNASTTVFPFSFSVPGNILPANLGDISVFFTDASGNVSLLVEGPASTQYQLAVNPITGTNPTPIGGSITYNPLGTPIPVGTSLTILRSLPLIQGASFSNQQTPYPTTIESAFDYSMMVSQQVLEVQDRALVVPISDPIPNPIPAVAARAGLVLGFDSLGEPIAVSTAPAGVISSAMAPVVGAATLAAARTAMGLGTIVTESIGLGLQDNGSGSLQTYYPEVSDSTPQSVVASFHANVRAATGTITYTLPLSSTLFNGFGFFIYARTAAVTVAINAADAFDGATTGASYTINAGSRVFISTNATGTWYVNGRFTPGQNAPFNAGVAASVASSAMTIALKDSAAIDPSAASPVMFATGTNSGASIARAVTTPLSITIPSGATLGTINGQTSRIWIGLFDNAGTPVLGVYNSLNTSSPTIVAWDETIAPTTTAISAGATSPQVWYTPSSVTAFFRILGYVESTQATAGTWSSAPSKIQLFGPGNKKPGDLVKAQYNPTATSVAFGLTSACNITAVSAGHVEQWGVLSTNTIISQLLRGASVISTLQTVTSTLSFSQFQSAFFHRALDFPNGTAPTYSLGVGGGTGTTISGNMEIEEYFV